MKPITTIEKQAIYNLHDLGKSSYSIAALIGRSTNCVVRTIKNRAGDKLYKTTPSGRRIYTREFTEQLKTLYAQGLSVDDLSQRFFMTPISVRNIVVGRLTNTKKAEAPPEPVVVPEPEPVQYTMPLEHKYVFHLGIGAEELKMINHLVKHFVQEFDKR